MTNASTPTKYEKHITQNANNNFDYTVISDRPRTIRVIDDSYPTGVVNPATESQPTQ